MRSLEELAAKAKAIDRQLEKEGFVPPEVFVILDTIRRVNEMYITTGSMVDALEKKGLIPSKKTE